MAATAFKFLFILPLFFLSGNAQTFFQNPFTKFLDHFPKFGQNEPKDINVNASESSSGFSGKWELVSENSGVSAMHAILLPNIDKVLMYDATIWKISNIPLPPQKMPCRVADKATGELDCWCHSVLFDIETSQLKALKLETDTWCSSGGLTIDGNFVSAGGNGGGANTVRYLSTCDTCDWRENPIAMADPRWYATQVTLPDGGFIVVGGRGAFSYEYIPQEGQSNEQAAFLPLLKNTNDQLFGADGQAFFTLENNLYPFVHLSPDGNLFIFSNNRSILLDPASNNVVREFPELPGGSRNYPSSGMSALLPLKMYPGNATVTEAEVVICGGAKSDSFYFAEIQKQFLPALQDCGRITITDQNPAWKIEKMPSPRIMGDVMILPTGDLLMLNGAKVGTAAWNDADDPNLVPVLYRPNAPEQERFMELAATTIPRMYHSSSVLLPDGKVLVAGSNTHDGYNFNATYPTELRVEKFSPTYLDPSLANLRQNILERFSDKMMSYGSRFSLTVRSNLLRLNKDELQVTMYAPAFSTHGVSMNQRLIVLSLVDVVTNRIPGFHRILAEAPSSSAVAPPGYYLLYVVYKGVPSKAVWVQIK